METQSGTSQKQTPPQATVEGLTVEKINAEVAKLREKVVNRNHQVIEDWNYRPTSQPSYTPSN